MIKNTHCSTGTASMNGVSPIPVAVLLGPTAVGKSDLALALASEMGWEIISCDSRQIYRGMNIGTAKPSIEELARVQHWLIDILDPAQEYSAWRFAEDAGAVIRERALAGKRVLVCGGTGLYFHALQSGRSEREPSDPAVRATLAGFALRNGSAALHAELAAVDPATAQRLHVNDTQRIIRALALYRQTGKTMADHTLDTNPPSDLNFTVIKLEMERSALYERINRRVDAMFAAGLWDEFLGLRSAGFGRQSPGLRSVGYRELFAVEEGSATMAGATELIKRNSRRYAKRQITWFAHQAEGVTVDMADAGKALEKVREYVG
jgi:tRNA dimethylallyltransferase